MPRNSAIADITLEIGRAGRPPLGLLSTTSQHAARNWHANASIESRDPSELVTHTTKGVRDVLIDGP
jgi:hypothetical protein